MPDPLTAAPPPPSSVPPPPPAAPFPTLPAASTNVYQDWTEEKLEDIRDPLMYAMQAMFNMSLADSGLVSVLTNTVQTLTNRMTTVADLTNVVNTLIGTNSTIPSSDTTTNVNFFALQPDGTYSYTKADGTVVKNGVKDPVTGKTSDTGAAKALYDDLLASGIPAAMLKFSSPTNNDGTINPIYPNVYIHHSDLATTFSNLQNTSQTYSSQSQTAQLSLSSIVSKYDNAFQAVSKFLDLAKTQRQGITTNTGR